MRGGGNAWAAVGTHVCMHGHVLGMWWVWVEGARYPPACRGSTRVRALWGCRNEHSHQHPTDNPKP